MRLTRPGTIFKKRRLTVKRKVLYSILLAFLILGLLGPALYSDMVGKKNTAGSGDESVPSIAASGGSPGMAGGNVDIAAKNGTAAAPSPKASPSGKSQKEENGLNDKKSPTAPEKAAAPQPAGRPEGETVNILVAVVGMNEELLYGPDTLQLAKKESGDLSPLDALEATGLSFGMSARTPGLLDSVAGQRNKGQGGWMYKVNEEVPPMAAAKKKLSAGDKVIWWYSKAIDNPPPDWKHLAK
jgi:hypothetical protein